MVCISEGRSSCLDINEETLLLTHVKSGNNRRPIRHKVKNEKRGHRSKVKVRTFRLPLLSGLRFHCLKKRILAVEAPLFTSVNSPLNLGGQIEKIMSNAFYELNLLSNSIAVFSMTGRIETHLGNKGVLSI